MQRRARATATLCGLVMVAILAAGAYGAAAGPERLSFDWIPAWGAELTLLLDGYASLYLLLIGGVGLAVVAYSFRYLPLHQEESGGDPAAQPRFYALLALFAVSMAGLAVAGDLLLAFLFWDATTVASYFLIGFDRHREEARSAAFTAVVVTGATAVLFLVGIAILWSEYGTFELELLFARAGDGSPATVAVALILVAALAKSAQVPFHFWLPRAMEAPTPVSAYLHSAAMVAAGVLLIGRIHPLIEADALRHGLLAVGIASILFGGLLALVQDELKRLLACSTFSQYGYVVALYGIGGPAAAVAASLYVLGHAVEKSALFLSAGVIGQATGSERLSELGGLRRSMPLLAFATGVAAAGVAGLPLTLGFFQDELFFEAAAGESTWLLAAFGVSAALSATYMGRFWLGLFAGPRRPRTVATPVELRLAVAVLAAVVVVGGLAVGPFLGLAEEAGGFTVQDAVSESAAYKLAATTENLVALAAYAAAALLLVAAPAWSGRLAAIAGRASGTGGAWDASLTALDRLSDRLHRIEVRDLRTRVVAVLVPAAALALFALVALAGLGGYEIGEFAERDIELAATLVVVSLAAVAMAGAGRHLPLALSLSGVGYGLAAAYAFFGAPDVAIVAVLVETTLALAFFGILALMPPEELRREARLSARRSPWRDRGIAVAAGAFVALVVWGGLSESIGGRAVGPLYPGLADEAHAGDVVTAILADFRALDTMGEISVVLVALLGVTGILRRRRSP